VVLQWNPRRDAVKRRQSGRRATVTVALLALVALLTGLAGLAAAGGIRAAAGRADLAAARATGRADLAVARAAGGAGLAAASSPSASPAVRQRITVTASSYGTTYATLRVYQLSGTKWVQVFGPWTARVGRNGVARPGTKREGDGKTPSGTYGFSFFFGVLANPGVSFPYRHAYAYDYWDDDPASPRYNEWVDSRSASAGRAPEPLHVTPAYGYAAVIAYNTARKPGLGSAIFFHVGTGRATAGCVSLPSAELVKVLRWLRPAANPTITITG
jgi:L,D-peptidoglycan transpeptidase YkuD (ErfK/YbiS/YcfS/YnhG family)